MHRTAHETPVNLSKVWPIPFDLNTIGVQELSRLVAERQGQPDGILHGDLPYLKVAAWIFSRIVRMRQRLTGRQTRRITRIYFRPWQRMYIGICHYLNCTPALPNRQESP